MAWLGYKQKTEYKQSLPTYEGLPTKAGWHTENQALKINLQSILSISLGQARFEVQLPRERTRRKKIFLCFLFEAWGTEGGPGRPRRKQGLAFPWVPLAKNIQKKTVCFPLGKHCSFEIPEAAHTG
jgi:hypothetical protein